MTGAPRIVIVAAVARDGTIGRGGGIPWRVPEDQQHFKRITMGTVLVVGRRTYDSFGRPLPGRDHVVITRDPAGFAASHAAVTQGPAARVFPVASFDAALALAATRGAATTTIAGGADVYAAALAVADEMVLTYVDHPGGGDTHFPRWDPAQWTEVAREPVGPATAVRYVRRV